MYDYYNLNGAYLFIFSLASIDLTYLPIEVMTN